MPLPPKLTRKLLCATCDKTALNCWALRICRGFKEANKQLGCGCHKKKGS